MPKFKNKKTGTIYKTAKKSRYGKLYYVTTEKCPYPYLVNEENIEVVND